MGGGEIEAQPDLLHGAGGRAGHLGAELAGFRSRLGTAGASAEAAGAPGARAAIGDSCQAWGAALEALEAHAAALGRNLHGAGDAYAATDGGVVPEGPPDGG